MEAVYAIAMLHIESGIRIEFCIVGRDKLCTYSIYKYMIFVADLSTD
jgi:hypothetical protein